jgi:tRNA-2-methylthio-N6-dimethylallyladenosine synthase
MTIRRTLDLMDEVIFDYGYMFYYSERPGTPAAKKYEDDVPLNVKKRRLNEIIEKQRMHSKIKNESSVGKTFKVLVEGESKKSSLDFSGRNDQNKMIVFPRKNAKKGDYVNVLVNSCTGGTLIGEII